MRSNNYKIQRENLLGYLTLQPAKIPLSAKRQENKTRGSVCLASSIKLFLSDPLQNIKYVTFPTTCHPRRFIKKLYYIWYPVYSTWYTITKSSYGLVFNRITITKQSMIGIPRNQT